MTVAPLVGTAEEAVALAALGTTAFADTEVGLLQQLLIILCVS
ncbi:MAG TPA: hypothetical protein PKZ19_15980 [Zoogloea sp.]|nr:hypothetical protein [Zoogloea sp.]